MFIGTRILRARCGRMREALRTNGQCWIAVALLALLACWGALAADSGGVVELLDEKIATFELRGEALGMGGSAPTLEVHRASVGLELPSGRPCPGNLVTAYEPDSGLFWWSFYRAYPGVEDEGMGKLLTRTSFFVSDTTLLGARFSNAPPTLLLRASSTRVASHQEGRAAAMRQLTRYREAIEDGSFRWDREVPLAEALGIEFFWDIRDPMPAVNARVLSIDPVDDGFLVRLRGREGREAEVRVDPLFNRRSVREVEGEPER